MYMMNSNENTTPASAVLDCSASAVRSADPVIYECLNPLTLECSICRDDKPPTAYDGFTFRCPCGAVNEDRDDKRICDKCVSDNLVIKSECPFCRQPNYAKKIKISYSNYEAIDLSFSFFTTYEPMGEIDPSLNYTQQKTIKYEYLKNVFTILSAKNVAFFDKVFSRLDDEDMTPRLQTIYNIFNFLEENGGVGFHNEEQMTTRQKWERFFVLEDEINLYSLTDLNTLKLFDWVAKSENEDFNPHDETFHFMINTYGDKWEHYRFNIYTEDHIQDRIDDELCENNIVYHNTYNLIDHLRSQELRNAFNAESHFWATARENEMGDEVRAILDLDAYNAWLLHSGYWKELVIMNWEHSTIIEGLTFDDYNGNFEDMERSNLTFTMEYDDCLLLDRP